jgi:hypothetical protein
VAGALFRAAFVASCFRGAFPPVDFLAVCLVRAILTYSDSLQHSKTAKTENLPPFSEKIIEI